jgi:hypothetical protein
VREKSAELESFWTRRSVSLSFVVVVVVSSLGYLLDRMLALQGISRGLMLLVTNTITGIVAGGLFYQMAEHEKRQREMVRARLKTIAELNHHIRNALQVIKVVGVWPAQPSLGPEHIQLINESVERVEWALREVLPGVTAVRPIDAGHSVVPRGNRAIL